MYFLGLGGSKICARNIHMIYLQQYSYTQYCYTLGIFQLIKNNEINLPFEKSQK